MQSVQLLNDGKMRKCWYCSLMMVICLSMMEEHKNFSKKLIHQIDLDRIILTLNSSFTPDDIIGNNFRQAWNKLSDTVKSLRSKLLFKKQLKDLKIAEYKSEMNCPPDCYICHYQQ